MTKVLYGQPRPQGFSLKKWVGPTHFLREKRWGRGCYMEAAQYLSHCLVSCK